MAFTFGFYNAEIKDGGAPDRTYNAEDFSKFLDGIISDGVVKPYGDAFNVSVVDAETLKISVGTGKGWFNGTWNVLDAPEEFTLPSKSGTYLVAVILQIDHASRTNQIYTAAYDSKITLMNNAESGRFEYCLAGIRVTDNAIVRANSHIGEGDPMTPWAKCLLPGDTSSGAVGVGRASAWDKTSEYFNDYENNHAGNKDKKEGSMYYATAKGVGTKATGYASFAVGVHTTASGYASIAIGEDSEASGYASFAGGGSKAKGRKGVAFINSEIAENSTESVALVDAKIEANVTNSFAAVGATLRAGYNNFAVGSNTVMDGTDNVAIGSNNKISGVDGTCLGSRNDSGTQCTTIGRYNDTSECSQILCVGEGLKSKSSVNSFNNHSASIFGSYNDPDEQYFRSGIKMMVGNGGGDSHRSNALAIFDDGTICCKKVRVQDPDSVGNVRFIDRAPTMGYVTAPGIDGFLYNTLILQYDPTVYVDENGIPIELSNVNGTARKLYRVTDIFILKEDDTP